METKKCFLITSHLSHNKLINVASEQLDLLNRIGLPIIFVGNYPIPKDIQLKTHYTLYDKDNPTIDRILLLWDSFSTDPILGKDIMAYRTNTDHGVAHLTQMLTGMKFCNALGYDKVFHLNYDVSFTPDNLNKFISIGDCKKNIFIDFYGEQDGDTMVEDSLGIKTTIFMINPNDFINIIEKNLHLYANNSTICRENNWIAEYFFRWCVDNSNIDFESSLDINIHCERSGISDELDTEYNLATYYIRRLDKIFIWDKKFKYSQNLKFKVNDVEIIADKLPSNYGFIVDSLDGEYYLFDDNKGEYIFGFNNDNNFRSTRYVESNES